jgi:hypothetical protein
MVSDAQSLLERVEVLVDRVLGILANLLLGEGDLEAEVLRGLYPLVTREGLCSSRVLAAVGEEHCLVEIQAQVEGGFE